MMLINPCDSHNNPLNNGKLESLVSLTTVTSITLYGLESLTLQFVLTLM